MIHAKSVQTRPGARDGWRILAARFRGRNLPADRYDIWMPNLGPSESLLRSFQAGAVSWAQFAKRYRAELFGSSDIDRHNRTIKNHGQKFTLRLLQELAQRDSITILCHCAEDEPHCHRHLLKAILERAI